MDRKIIILEYQDSFADDFSTYAYGKIAEKKFKSSVFYKNSTLYRQKFEDRMKNFNLECYYISKTRADKISENSSYMNVNELSSKKINADTLLKLNHFRIDDIKYLTNDIKESLDFNNCDFIKDYDILENIMNENSVGLYINKKDKIDFKYILNSINRLNKYVKRPVLYVFYKEKLTLDTDIKYHVLDIHDWKEEFYFLRKCKHNIIYCEENSYSEGLWAAVLNNYPFAYKIYNKKLKVTEKLDKWMAI